MGVYTTGFTVALAYYLINGVCLRRPYPYNTFLCLPSVRFSDFTNMETMCRDLDPYNSDPGSSYPPFANLLFYFFGRLGAPVGLLGFLLIPTAGLLLLAGAYTRRLGLRTQAWVLPCILLGSYPTLFALDRGNLDLVVAPLVAAFLFLYPRPDGPARDLACIALGIAIALKLYPLLFCLVFVWRRDLVALVQSAAVAVLLTVLACCCFPGGLTVAVQDFLGMLRQVRSLTDIELNFGYANVGLYYAGVLTLLKIGALKALVGYRAYYGTASMIALAACSALLIWRRLEYWATATGVATLICLVPALSNDYRLTILLPCIVLFIAKSGRRPTDLWIAVLFGLLLVPKNYLILFPEMPPGHVGIASLINPLLEVVLLAFVLKYAAQPSTPSTRPTEGS